MKKESYTKGGILHNRNMGHTVMNFTTGRIIELKTSKRKGNEPMTDTDFPSITNLTIYSQAHMVTPAWQHVR